MSKELKAFRKICRCLSSSYEFTDEYKKNKKLIETALVDNECYKKQIVNLEDLCEKHYDEMERDSKKVKAFEIIKRHPFAFASLAMFLENYNTYEEWEKINPNCFTKEEFDLLKEVLL